MPKAKRKLENGIHKKEKAANVEGKGVRVDNGVDHGGNQGGQPGDKYGDKYGDKAIPKLPKIVSFDAIARCGEEVWIENGGQIYRLRKTKQGKLILTK